MKINNRNIKNSIDLMNRMDNLYNGCDLDKAEPEKCSFFKNLKHTISCKWFRLKNKKYYDKYEKCRIIMDKIDNLKTQC